MISITPQMLLSRFNKNLREKGKYDSKNESDARDRDILHFPYDERNDASVSNLAISGKTNEVPFVIPHNQCASYQILGPKEKIIENKDEISMAIGVRINGNQLVRLPNDAVLPFCSMLNLLIQANER